MHVRSRPMRLLHADWAPIKYNPNHPNNSYACVTDYDSQQYCDFGVVVVFIPSFWRLDALDFRTPSMLKHAEYHRNFKCMNNRNYQCMGAKDHMGASKTLYVFVLLGVRSLLLAPYTSLPYPIPPPPSPPRGRLADAAAQEKDPPYVACGKRELVPNSSRRASPHPLRPPLPISPRKPQGLC
jgi:hypothetical protein